MEKIYNNSGVEVKRAIMGICPTCGLGRCEGYQHCLRCGQPLRFNDIKWDNAHYKEQYKDVEEEVKALENMDIDTKAILGIDNSLKPLSERRREIIEGINIIEYDVAALFQGRLEQIFPGGERKVVYEGINLSDYDVE